MSGLYSQFETNKDFEKDGINLEYVDGDTKITFKIARAGGANKNFQKALERRTRKLKRAIQMDTLPREQADAIMRETYAESVVLGWDNVTDKAGDVLEFNTDNCIKLFNDLPDLFLDIQEQANRSVLFRDAVRETESGN